MSTCGVARGSRPNISLSAFQKKLPSRSSCFRLCMRTWAERYASPDAATAGHTVRHWPHSVQASRAIRCLMLNADWRMS